LTFGHADFFKKADFRFPQSNKINRQLFLQTGKALVTVWCASPIKICFSCDWEGDRDGEGDGDDLGYGDEMKRGGNGDS
jgi:hypothetical protein